MGKTSSNYCKCYQNLWSMKNFHFDHLAIFLLWVKLKIAFVDKYLFRLCEQNELCHRIFLYMSPDREIGHCLCVISHIKLPWREVWKKVIGQYLLDIFSSDKGMNCHKRTSPNDHEGHQFSFISYHVTQDICYVMWVSMT